MAGGLAMKRMLCAAALILAAHTMSAEPASAQGVPADAVKQLAPTGVLRAAVNYGNSVLAQKGPDGAPQGVSADLARELAKRLDVPLAFVPFAAAGKAFAAAQENRVDVLFVA